MSKKKEILVVAFISTTLFAGLTAYTHANSSSRTPARGAAPAAAQTMQPSGPVLQPPGNGQGQVRAPERQQAAEPAPTPADATRKKAKTRAS